MTKLSGSREFKRGDRFFQMAEYITIYLDMEINAICAARKLLPKHVSPPGNYYADLDCNQFPVRIRHHVFGPFHDSFDKPREKYYFDFYPQQPVSLQVTLTSSAMGACADMFWNTSLVFLYEQYRPWLQQTFGSGPKDRNNWPEIFRFAWALRNAAAHHHGALNITDKAVPPVRWHHLSFDHRDEGLRVYGNVMHMGDMLVLFLEMSDELDRLGAPHP